MTKRKFFKVTLVNLQTIHAMCGYGEGKTLREAQEDALRQARQRDPNARLSDGGYEVWFNGGINC